MQPPLEGSSKPASEHPPLKGGPTWANTRSASCSSSARLPMGRLQGWQGKQGDGVCENQNTGSRAAGRAKGWGE